MPIKSKWILTLGILAMSPSLAMAKNPFSIPGLTKSASTEAAAKTNQDVANEIANALRQARLTGHDINIEFKEGVATLTGMIQDSSQKATAERLTAQVSEVTSVNNQLGLINPDAGQAVQQTAFEAPMQQAQTPAQPSQRVEQAAYQASDAQPIASPIMQTAGQQSPSAKAQNQQVANNIAQALKASGLSGYDIEISYKEGVASLNGQVGTPGQVQHVHHVVSQVPGVKSVNNQLRAAGPVTQTAAFQPPLTPNGPMGDGENGGAYPPGPGAYPPGPGAYPPSAMAGGPAMGHPGPGPVNPVYNQPNLPGHAWPTYASYPNYAAVTYPTQYSASAFPYIGPFYPYPQVPLGWRSSTLEWDDGHWQLTFSPKTDRWWWFMNPKNWD